MTTSEQEYLDHLAEAVAEKVLAALDTKGVRALLTVPEVAQRLGISERGVRDLVNGRDGRPPKLPSFKVGPNDGTRVVAQSALDEYLERQRSR